MDSERILVAEQWAALRDVVLSAGYANVIEGLSRELQRRADGSKGAYGRQCGETAALLRQAATRYRDMG